MSHFCFTPTAYFFTGATSPSTAILYSKNGKSTPEETANCTEPQKRPFTSRKAASPLVGCLNSTIARPCHFSARNIFSAWRFKCTSSVLSRRVLGPPEIGYSRTRLYENSARGFPLLNNAATPTPLPATYSWIIGATPVFLNTKSNCASSSRGLWQ